MAKVHGKGTYVSINGVDISTYCNNVEFSRSSDSHDTTTFGNGSKVYTGGLKDGTVSISGFYDDAAAGPQATIEALLGTVVPLIYRAKGTGTGRISKTVSALVTSYDETAPVADMVSWSCELQMSSDVVAANQP